MIIHHTLRICACSRRDQAFQVNLSPIYRRLLLGFKQKIVKHPFAAHLGFGSFRVGRYKESRSSACYYPLRMSLEQFLLHVFLWCYVTNLSFSSHVQSHIRTLPVSLQLAALAISPVASFLYPISIAAGNT